MRTITLFVPAAALALALAAPAVSAQTRSQVYGDNLTKQAQTVYVRADAGMTTYESEAAGSKETRESMTYEVGGWAGERRLVGVAIKSSEAEVPFELNDSEVQTSFRDVKLKVRLGWLVPSIGMSLSEVDVTRDEEGIVGLYGTGASVGLGINVPIYERLVLSGEGMTVQSSKVYDKLGQDAELGRRDEADGTLSFDLTELAIDLLIGYRLRSYDVSVGETTYKEKAQGAYAGVRFGLYF